MTTVTGDREREMKSEEVIDERIGWAFIAAFKAMVDESRKRLDEQDAAAKRREEDAA